MSELKRQPLVVSIVIGSIRPHQFTKCLDSIYRYTGDISYEVVLVTPNEAEPHPNLNVVKDRGTGYYPAISDALEQASGTYIIHIADDCRATPFWASNMVRYMQPHDNEIFEGSYRHFDVKGERFPQGHYGKLIAPFICIRRDVIPRIGGLMDMGRYTAFYGDPDLSLRVWQHGGSVGTCPDAFIYHCDDDDAQYHARQARYGENDLRTFKEHWFPIMGRPGDTDWGREQPLPGHPELTGLPPEMCTRIYDAINKKDWKIVITLTTHTPTDIPTYPEGFEALYQLTSLSFKQPGTSQKALQMVRQWLKRNGYKPSASQPDTQNISRISRAWRYWFDLGIVIADKADVLDIAAAVIPSFIKKRLLSQSNVLAVQTSTPGASYLVRIWRYLYRLGVVLATKADVLDIISKLIPLAIKKHLIPPDE